MSSLTITLDAGELGENHVGLTLTYQCQRARKRRCGIIAAIDRASTYTTVHLSNGSIVVLGLDVPVELDP